MLCEVAWITASHREFYLSGWYWRVKQRKGAKRATIALARKLLSIIYILYKTALSFMRNALKNAENAVSENVPPA